MITHAINTFKTGTYTVQRYTAGTYDANGAFVPSAAATTSIVAAIQPISGMDLKTLPEGQKVEDTRLVLTTYALLDRDVITYKSEAWTVTNVQDWALRGATWSKALIMRNTVGV